MDFLKETDRGGINIRHAIDEQPDSNGFYFHIHDRCELFYFISGNAQYLVEGSVYPLEHDSLLIMRPGEAHRTRFLSAERYERYAVNFPLSLFDSFDPERRLMKPFTDRPLGHRNHYYIPGIKDTLSELAYFEGDDYSRTLLFTTKLAGVMDMLCEEITVERLAEHFFLSASQFTRLFKESTGAAPWAYITAKRLVRARELLQSGESAKRAAEVCGFNDYSVFYKAYVKHFGEKPSAFAKDAII